MISPVAISALSLLVAGLVVVLMLGVSCRLLNIDTQNQHCSRFCSEPHPADINLPTLPHSMPVSFLVNNPDTERLRPHSPITLTPLIKPLIVSDAAGSASITVPHVKSLV